MIGYITVILKTQEQCFIRMVRELRFFNLFNRLSQVKQKLLFQDYFSKN